MKENNITEILDKLMVFDKMYEVIRFIDPIRKEVSSYNKKTLDEREMKCFEFWGKNKICNNCISIRAYNDNKTYVKIEYSTNKVFMVTAVPYELEDRRIIIELLKDTTDSMVLEGGEGSIKSEVNAMIDSMNNLLLKDTLTDVYNRRYINEKLPIDVVSSELTQKDISIIMSDVDYFKKVNDTYGHLAGDEILKSFASTLRQCIKSESDWVARFGGEEFLICLPGVSQKEAIEVAEKMRRLIESKDFVYNDEIIKITSSFGVCTIRPNQESKIENLIELADQKLYEAKKNGRNRVEY